jgi:hypothetical protein
MMIKQHMHNVYLHIVLDYQVEHYNWLKIILINIQNIVQNDIIFLNKGEKKTH